MVRWVNALNPTSARALRNVYAQIPDLHCKGLCANSCRTRIDMSVAERERIEGITGARLPERMFQREGLVCPLLHEDRAARDEASALVRKRFPDGFTAEQPPL